MKKGLVLVVILAAILAVSATCFSSDTELKHFGLSAGVINHGADANLTYDDGTNHLVNAASLTWSHGPGETISLCGHGGHGDYEVKGGPSDHRNKTVSTDDTRWTGTIGHAWNLSDKWEGYVGVGVEDSHNEGMHAAAEVAVKRDLKSDWFVRAGYIHTFGGYDQDKVSLNIGKNF